MIAGPSLTTPTNWVYTITSDYVTTGGSYVTENYPPYLVISYSSPPDDPIQVFKSALSARKALFLAWNKEASKALFKMTFDRMPFPGRPLDRLCYGQERRKLPVRQLFKKRVCGGHQRYRVLQP